MLFFNEDWLHYLWTRFETKEDINETVLRDFIYQYRGTQITDFCLNVNGTVSSSPSNVLETFCHKYHARAENGLDVDYTNTYAYLSHVINEELKLDQYAVWIDALREINIRPWISFRLNDCHGNERPTDLRKSVYVEDHPEQWRVRHRTPIGYYDKCLDYTLPQVRDRMLSYISEQVNRYFPDGVELDFTREMNMVSIGAEYDSFDIITGFVEAVHTICEQASLHAGHPIKLGVLVGANVSATFNQGFDVNNWCNQSLVDYVTILPRWETINPNMDIGLWKRIVTGSVKLGTGLQLLANSVADGSGKMALIDHDFGQSVANLSLGADFIYLYNHFDTVESGLNGVMTVNSVREPENLSKILHNVATLDTAILQKRRHLLTYDDYTAPWETRSARLPLTISGGFRQVRIAVGKIPSHATVKLVLGFSDAVNPQQLEVYVNSCPVSYLHDGGRFDGKESSCTFSVPPHIMQTYAIVEIAYKDKACLNFAEIIVE